MNAFFGMSKSRILGTLTAAAAVAAMGVSVPAASAAAVPAKAPVAGTAKAAPEEVKALLRGSTTGSYFWDDASGRQGDTGLPAIGKPMEKGMFASPSWPLGTEGYVMYKGKKAEFFIGDRGPGVPSESGVMLDLDGKTFAELTGGTWNSDTLTVEGVGGEGHIDISYVVTKWGKGPGMRGAPVPFSTGAWRS
jgi:hypothetical protein